MEFYSVGARIYAKNRKVSIPNGMEFYAIASASFSPSPSFNSQRDGILLFKNPEQQKHIQFQFPTGWNSTLLHRLWAKPRWKFQFPTGWNSTQDHRLICFIPHSFNSQRDGILLICHFVLIVAPVVSIPNGMEFYGKILTIREICEYSFNSQRDGILPRARSFRFRA